MKRFTMKAVSLGIVMCVGLSPLSAAPLAKVANEGNISGFFLGAELGYSASFTNEITPSENVTTGNDTTRTDRFALGTIGAKLGYTHFFNKWVGLRGYASYHYGYDFTNTVAKTAGDGTTAGTTTTTSNLISAHQVAGNIDVAFKFFDTSSVGLGAFVGVGFGYGTTNTTGTDEATNTITTTNNASGFILPINAGLEVYMGSHHSASLNFRIPTLAYKGVVAGADAQTGSTTTEIRNLIITLGYSYTF